MEAGWGRRARGRAVAVLGWEGWLKLASIATAVGVLIGLWFTAGSFEATSRQIAIADRAEVTSRFAKAIEQLGTESVDVRLGGIYTLEGIARDSDAYRSTVFEVLGSFVRTHAPVAKECALFPAADIQAAATVIGRRTSDTLKIDLSGACLSGVDLRSANLRGAILNDVDLTSALLIGADLRDSRSANTNFRAARLGAADLTGAALSLVNFAEATFVGPDATGDSVDAGWSYYLPVADNRFSAKLDRVVFRNCYYDETTQWPPGFVPPKKGSYTWRD
ncbi:pentapeptide repeat-containing protein [Nocardia sp. NPDC050712]|uniref:pentapeptide repeat-containing protein n=1 Tax=Nocardia sp. NPDC050712 TaxID=3155518 RepID=UPI0033E1302E